MVKWLFAAAVILKHCVGDAFTEHWPRFVLCPQSSNTTRDDVGDVVVFAASVTTTQPRPGRVHRPLSLRAALLQHGLWDVALAEQPQSSRRLGHAKNVSYDKCFGSSLPADTIVFCGLGKTDSSRRNTSWTRGRLARFDTGEVRQSFATCTIEHLRLVKTWRRHPSRWPLRLNMRLWLSVPGRASRVILPLQLCRVDQPVQPISFCSQPLYNFKPMQGEWPHVMDDWLAYHLDYLGFSHGDIYDVDGSFADALDPWIRANSWRKNTMTYIKEWPKQLSRQLHDISKSHPYCTEMLAYAHCLTSHAARSRWVALLHAPDEYLVARKNPQARALPQVMSYLSHDLVRELPFAFFQVNAVSFATENWNSGGRRGGVLTSSRLRMPHPYHHMVLADPLNCWAAGPHMCYGEARAREI